MTAETRKNWGTIFMGTQREVNLDQLASVMPQGSGFWNRDQESAYFERVQRRAEEQARTILAQAGRERAALLEEARCEIARVREEAQRQAAALLAERQSRQAESVRLHEEARLLHEEARLLHAGAEEAGHAAGYAAGIGQAQADLEHFRAVMGEATGAVLSAVHAQCGRIFASWKEDLCALLLACVEKGTGLALDRDRALLLEQLLSRAVALLEAHTSAVVRVWPDDEAVVADMVAAAKERIPGLGSWIVRGDPELAPGDLVLEAAHSRVESRIEERRNAVDAALRHVLLPDAPEEEKGRDELAQVHAGAVARMLELVPKRPAVPAVPDEAARTDGAERPHPEAEDAAPPAEDACPATEQAAAADETAAEEQAAEPPAEAPAPAAPQVDLRMVLGRPPTADPAVLDAADAVDAVLAAGGFLPATEEA